MQKREHIELKLCAAEIRDNGKVRIGALSPSFPAAPSSTAARGEYAGSTRPIRAEVIRSNSATIGAPLGASEITQPSRSGAPPGGPGARGYVSQSWCSI